MTVFDQPVPLYTGEELDTMHPLRARLLEFAAAQLGQQDPDRYWRKVCPELCGAPHRISWCGGFYLYNLTEVAPARVHARADAGRPRLLRKAVAPLRDG